MPLKDLIFQIPIYPDTKVHQLINKVFKETKFDYSNVTIHTSLGGQPLTISKSTVDTNEEIQEIFNQNSELIELFSYPIDNGINLQIRRTRNNLEKTQNQININLISVDESKRQDLYSFIGSIRKHFKAIDSATFATTILNKDVKRQYEFREKELTKLGQIAENIFENQTKYKNEIDKELKKKITSIEKECDEKKAQLDDQFNKKKVALGQEESKLEKRIKEIDNRDSKHVRRELREQLKQEFKNRSEEFELTQGTKRRRKPIQYFTLFLLLFFISGLTYYSYLFIENVLFSENVASSVTWSITIKQIAFALAFGSTSIFYLRWNNKWFEQHANEEFKLKKYDIDLDRASWLVEMALEWNEEKGTDLPTELLEKLSHNLFVEETMDDADLHPSDQLASALFGASSKATVQLPGGSKVEIDRKGIKNLKK